MQDDRLKLSLEDLFSDMPSPVPDGAAQPPPPTPPTPPIPPERPAAAEQVTPPVPPEALAASFRPTGLSIRQRLIWGFVIVLLLLLASTLTNAFLTSRVEQAVASLQREGDRSAAALRVAWASADLLGNLSVVSAAQEATNVAEMIAQSRATLADAYWSLRDAVADLPLDDPIHQETGRVEARTNRLDSLAYLILLSAQDGNWETVRYYQTQFFDDYRALVVESVDRIVALTEERQAAAGAAATRARQLAVGVPAGFAILAMITAAGTALATIRSITRPVARLAQSASRLAKGHWGERTPVLRRDELGYLATVFNDMASRLQALYTEMEQRVAERTRALQEANASLQRRATQLEASAEIARAITSIFDVDTLLQQTVNLIRERFGFYHAGIFLTDTSGKWMVLREATGEAGALMKAQGHRLPINETSMVGWTALHREPRIALHAAEDAVRFAHPLLPYTRSEMTLPMMIGDRFIGVLNVQSTQEAAFDSEDVRVLQSMANQVAIAIENAQRVSREAGVLEASSPAYRIGRLLTAAETSTEVADVIINAVQGTEADGCAVIQFELSPDGEPEALSYLGVWRADREPQFQPGLRLPIQESPFPPEIISTMWTSTDVESDERLPDSARRAFQETGVRALVNIPLHAAGRLIGQVVVLRNAPGPFSDTALRVYEALADQAAIALERVRLMEETRRRATLEHLVSQVTAEIRRPMDMESVLRTTLQELGTLLQASEGMVRLNVGPLPPRPGATPPLTVDAEEVQG